MQAHEQKWTDLPVLHFHKCKCSGDNMPIHLVPLQLPPFKLKHLVWVPSRPNLYFPKSRTEYTTIFFTHIPTVPISVSHCGQPHTILTLRPAFDHPWLRPYQVLRTSWPICVCLTILSAYLLLSYYFLPSHGDRSLGNSHDSVTPQLLQPPSLPTILLPVLPFLPIRL